MSAENRLSCDVSRELNEPLYGTIKPADIFFLVEYNGTYENEAWEAADIPQAAKDRLNNYPKSHPLLIRQPGKFAEHDRVLTMFVVHANTTTPQIYRLDLNSYNDLVELDLDAILRGELVIPEDDPLYVVCTNGKRDQCCSKWGTEVYNGLSAIAGDQVWQSSHIGGHRLAATMYCFPHALCYGFLSEADTPEVVESYQQGRMLLNKFRGRAIVQKPIQAAEYFLRRELNEDRIEELTYAGHEENDGNWLVQLDVSGKTYQVHIQKAAPLEVLATTGDAQYKEMPQFALMGYDAVES